MATLHDLLPGRCRIGGASAADALHVPASMRASAGWQVRGAVSRGDRPDRASAARRPRVHDGARDGRRRDRRSPSARSSGCCTTDRTTACRFPTRSGVRAVRVPLLDARFFVTAVLTQRESGGNLSEVLDNLSKVIRERFTLKRQVRTLSAHGRITGWVLAALPIVLGALMFALNPEHMGVLFTDSLGVRMIVGSGRPAGHRLSRDAAHREHRDRTEVPPCL